MFLKEIDIDYLPSHGCLSVMTNVSSGCINEPLMNEHDLKMNKNIFRN